MIQHAGGGSFKSQMKRADASGAEVAVIVGDDETAAGEASVKPLRADRGQQRVPIDRLPAVLTDTIYAEERMATYDLEEQEQLAELKAFWKQHGNLILIAMVGGASRRPRLPDLDVPGARKRPRRAPSTASCRRRRRRTTPRRSAISRAP